MIGRIRGILADKQPPHLLIDSHGVGYEIEAPMSVFYRLSEVGKEVMLYTHFVVRDDTRLLYGFNSKAERELFRTLIKVNGVGPKLGLTLLSSIKTDMFVRCVQTGDSGTLLKLPGVGKKTSERLIVEMKDKLDRWSASFLDSQPMLLEDEIADNATNNDVEQEAVTALTALGYKHQKAIQVIAKLFRDGMSSEELIRQSLKNMI